MSIDAELDKQIVEGIRSIAKNVAREIEEARHTCLTCMHFDETSETCMLANARPPARVIALGCKAWDNIPF